MSDYKIGILTIAFNRPDNLLRLLTFIDRAYFDSENIDLLISIDNSGTDAVEKVAHSFLWKYGHKKIYTYPERMGLRKHILHCGNYLNNYDALIVLEDDLVVAPAFYQFAKIAVDKYSSEKSIAGISLYTPLWNHNAGYPFAPCNSQFDVYFMQMAQSWGQIWLANQWMDFIKWYELNTEFEVSDDFPDFMTNWSNSWLKYHNKYCVEKNKYFVYPYVGYTTCFSEVGEHSVLNSSNFQVSMLMGTIDEMRLPDLGNENAIKYDIFYERQGMGTYLNLYEKDLTVDLYGKKIRQETKRRYLLTTRCLPYKVKHTYGLQMRPQEQNVLYDVLGNEIFLYDTSQQTNFIAQGLKAADKYVYFHRIYGNTKILAKVLINKVIESVQITIARSKKRGLSK